MIKKHPLKVIAKHLRPSVKKRLWLSESMFFSAIAVVLMLILLLYQAGLQKQQAAYEALKEDVEARYEANLTIEDTFDFVVGQAVAEEEITPLEAKYRYYEETYGIEIPRRSMDLDTLCADINADIYAWIYVPGTEIDYPILQHPTDDAYYLEHNLDGSSGYPGCIYTESANSLDFTDRLTVLYGHNMRNGTMFGTLKRFKDTEVFEENEFFFIYLEDDILVYQIFRAYRFSDAHLLATYDTITAEGFTTYLEMVKSYSDTMSNVRSDVLTGLTSEDHIVTLSTCISGQDDKRYLVQGVLLAYAVEE